MYLIVYQRREVLGLALANVVSGIVGGIPATAALARTGLNIKSGATNYKSAVINSVAVFLISLILLRFFKYLPMCIVASILVMVAIRMVETEHVVHLWKVDRRMFVLSILVAALCILSDPTTGILFGTVIALLMFSDALSSGHTDIIINHSGRVTSHLNLTELDKIPKSMDDNSLSNIQETHNDTIIYRYNGELTYINSLAHVERLKRLNYAYTVLSLKHTFYLDLDGLDALEEMIADLESRGSTVYLAGVQDIVTPILRKAPWFTEIKQKGLVLETEQQCMQQIELGLAQSVVADQGDTELNASL